MFREPECFRPSHYVINIISICRTMVQSKSIMVKVFESSRQESIEYSSVCLILSVIQSGHGNVLEIVLEAMKVQIY